MVVPLGPSCRLLIVANISKPILLLIDTLEDILLAKSIALSSYSVPLAIRYL